MKDCVSIEFENRRYQMNAELYITKASLQISKGEIDKAVDSMMKAINIGNDMISVTQAHCFLGEYYFVNQDYASSKEHLEWIAQRQEELEAECDDLLNDEIDKANLLLDMMETFSLIE